MTADATPAKKRLIALHEDDTVMVCIAPIGAGEPMDVDGVEVKAAVAIDVGHKVARRDLTVGDKVIKYGAPIGSMSEAACRGEHVHVHNMRSDYIPSHTRHGVTPNRTRHGDVGSDRAVVDRPGNREDSNERSFE